MSPDCARSRGGLLPGDKGVGGCDMLKSDLVRDEFGLEGTFVKVGFRLNAPFSDCLLKAANSGLDSMGTCLGLSSDT